jgi:hypothetical protein
MAQTVVFRDVPKDDVDQFIDDIKKVGPTKVEKLKQDGEDKYTVIVTFPD